MLEDKPETFNVDIMTNGEKQLLLQDLCARLPYGVNCEVFNGKYDEDMKLSPSILSFGVENIKPYLRPISSMTDDEEIGYDATFDTIYVNGHYDSVMTYKSFDWLNAHHFDCRGLIEKRLALPAPEGMYDIK